MVRVDPRFAVRRVASNSSTAMRDLNVARSFASPRQAAGMRA